MIRLYSSNDQSQRYFLSNWLDAHIQDAEYLLHKPLLITEFGKSWKDPGFIPYQRDMVFNTVYSKIYASAKRGGAASGGLFWQLLVQGMDSFRDGYDILLEENSSTANLITQQARKLYEIRKIVSRARWFGGNRGKPIGN